MKPLAPSFTLAVLVAGSSLANASNPAVAEAAIAPAAHLDVEVDPLAYVLGGYSVHVGLGWRSLRLDFGVYALDVPELLHGNEGFDVRFDGYGAKLQWFPFAEQKGGFIDVSGGVSHQKIQPADSDMTARNTTGSIGVDFGWRFSLPARFYATTWAGVGYDFGVEDVMLGGKTYKASSITTFAAVHLGYRFR